MSADLAPPPPIEPDAPMIARTARIVIARPVAAVAAWMVAARLEDHIPATKALPGVTGTTPLTPGPWGVPGARRVVHLSDGSQTTEQVLAMTPEGFRYQVWGYTTVAARPIAYALGEFRYVPKGERTEIVWTYAFRLKTDAFPGNLGAFGRWLLKTVFLDGPYATLMRETLKTMKALAERDA